MPSPKHSVLKLEQKGTLAFSQCEYRIYIWKAGDQDLIKKMIIDWAIYEENWDMHIWPKPQVIPLASHLPMPSPKHSVLKSG